VDFVIYGIGDSGFAYVTRTEMIRPTGEPWPLPDRFPNDVRTASGSDGFLDFIISRFRARPGYFRIIAVVVTSRIIHTTGAAPGVNEMIQIVRGGMLTLPPSLARRAVRNLECVALVYEFERPTAAGEVTLRSAPLVSAVQHLAGAGLWSTAQLESPDE
jgi:hypothetical protein